MKIYKVDDQQQSFCQTCDEIRQACLQLRDVPLSDNTQIIRNVLVGVCESCNETVFVPHQSVPLIKKQLDHQKKSIETRVPAHMVDILNLASEKLGGTTDFANVLIKYYLHNLSEQNDINSSLTDYLQSDLAKGVAQKRISLKGRQVSSAIDQIKIKTRLTKTTDVLKAVVLKINDDVLVQQHSGMIKQLKHVVAAFS